MQQNLNENGISNPPLASSTLKSRKKARDHYSKNNQSLVLMRFSLYSLSQQKEKPLEKIKGKQNKYLRRIYGARGSLKKVQGRKRIRGLGVV